MAIQQTIQWPASVNPARHGLRRLTRRCGQALSRAVRRVQYGQMVSVLIRLPDQQLAQIGIRRSDIPAYARKLIYGAGR